MKFVYILFGVFMLDILIIDLFTLIQRIFLSPYLSKRNCQKIIGMTKMLRKM